MATDRDTAKMHHFITLTLVYTVLVSVVYPGEAAPVFKKHVLEMSHAFNNETIYWPTGPVTNFTLTVREREIPAIGKKIASGYFTAAEHGGTHMDSPYHFNTEHGLKIHEIPTERMVAPAVVLDIRDKVEKDPTYEATMADYMKWEEKHGEMSDNSVLLLCNGWEKKWPDKSKIFGTDDFANIDNSLRMPGIEPGLVRWLIANRNMAGIGTDTPTPDGTRTIRTGDVHVLTAAENMYILENVKGVCDIPHNGVTLLIFPMKIEGGTGAPTRIVGTWGDDVYSGAERHVSSLLVALTATVILLISI